MSFQLGTLDAKMENFANQVLQGELFLGPMPSELVSLVRKQCKSLNLTLLQSKRGGHLRHLASQLPSFVAALDQWASNDQQSLALSVSSQPFVKAVQDFCKARGYKMERGKLHRLTEKGTNDWLLDLTISKDGNVLGTSELVQQEAEAMKLSIEEEATLMASLQEFAMDWSLASKSLADATPAEVGWMARQAGAFMLCVDVEKKLLIRTAGGITLKLVSTPQLGCLQFPMLLSQFELEIVVIRALPFYVAVTASLPPDATEITVAVSRTKFDPQEGMAMFSIMGRPCCLSKQEEELVMQKLSWGTRPWVSMFYVSLQPSLADAVRGFVTQQGYEGVTVVAKGKSLEVIRGKEEQMIAARSALDSLAVSEVEAGRTYKCVVLQGDRHLVTLLREWVQERKYELSEISSGVMTNFTISPSRKRIREEEVVALSSAHHHRFQPQQGVEPAGTLGPAPLYDLIAPGQSALPRGWCYMLHGKNNKWTLVDHVRREAFQCGAAQLATMIRDQFESGMPPIVAGTQAMMHNREEFQQQQKQLLEQVDEEEVLEEKVEAVEGEAVEGGSEAQQQQEQAAPKNGEVEVIDVDTGSEVEMKLDEEAIHGDDIGGH